jgi:hypothetical protein
MIRWFLLALMSPRDRFRSQEQLTAEIILLRHQLIVLRRQVPGRVRLHGLDRALLVWLCRLFPALLEAMVIVRPETVIGWHRAGIEPGGAGNREFQPDGRGSTENCAILSVRCAGKTRSGVHRAFTASC